MLLNLLLKSCWESIYMICVSGFLSCFFGIPLGVALFSTKKGSFLEAPYFFKFLSFFLNIGRSIPFIILLVAIIPLTRMIIGTSIGTQAAVVPLTFAAIPFVARLVEGVLSELPKGLIEALQSMGASPKQIIIKAVLPESLAGIINAITLTLVNLVGYSAMAGVVGGGGLGDLAIRFGYQRFDAKIMLITVAILIALVQLIQSTGDYLSSRARGSSK